MVSDMDLVYYCIQYDETTNNENVKELRILIRYWSKLKNEVVTRHLETFFLGSATSKILKEKIVTAIGNANLPLTDIIQLASDSPNVNKAVFSLINNDLIRIRKKKLFDGGYCNIHTVHNAFRKGIDEFGLDVSDTILTIHDFIYDFPVRVEAFETIQKRLNLPQHRLRKHVESRWLSLEAGCIRVIEQLPAIKEYFLTYIPNTATTKHLIKTRRYKSISNHLKSPTFEAEVNFVASSGKLFTAFTQFFQTSGPLIHLLFDKIDRLVTTIVHRICKEKCKASELFLPDNLLPLEEIILNEEINENLKSVGCREVLEFRKGVQQHYIAACTHILQKTVLNPELPEYILKNFRFLLPFQIKNKKKQNIKDVTKVISKMHVSLSLENAIDELKILQVEISDIDNKKLPPVREYWQEVFQAKLPCGKSKFSTLTLLAQVSFLLYHGSADVERSFSESHDMLTEKQTKMSVEHLNAKLNVKSTLKLYDNKVLSVPIPPELLKKARAAHSLYKAHLEKVKADEERDKRKYEEEERLKKEEEGK